MDRSGNLQSSLDYQAGNSQQQQQEKTKDTAILYYRAGLHYWILVVVRLVVQLVIVNNNNNNNKNDNNNNNNIGCYSSPARFALDSGGCPGNRQSSTAGDARSWTAASLFIHSPFQTSFLRQPSPSSSSSSSLSASYLCSLLLFLHIDSLLAFLFLLLGAFEPRCPPGRPDSPRDAAHEPLLHAMTRRRLPPGGRS